MKRLTVLLVLFFAVKGYSTIPGPGALRFSEAMVRGHFGVQWLELVNTTERTLNLEGCELRIGLSRIKRLVFKRFLLGPHGTLLLSSSDFPTECGIHPDVILKGLYMHSTRPEKVVLWCPWGKTGAVVDTLMFNLSSARIQRGYSIEWCGNDEHQGLLKGWKQTPEGEYCEILGTKEFGSPGEPNECSNDTLGQQILPGDLEVTEVMVMPVSGTPEWVEITNTTTKPKELVGCVLKISHDNKTARFPLDEVVVPPADSVVLCSAPLVAGPGHEAQEFVVNGLRLVDSKKTELSVLCWDKEICSVTYDPLKDPLKRGHSLCFEYATDPAHPSKVISSGLSNPYSSSPQGINYGTPFDPAPCPETHSAPLKKISSVGCSVASFDPYSPSTGIAAFLLFSVLLLVWLQGRIVRRR